MYEATVREGVEMMDDDLLILGESETECETGKDFWNVLIVDDESEVHMVTKLVLGNFVFAERGIKFYSVYSEAEAREFLRDNHDIALIMLDVVMEDEESGLRLVQYIRRDLENHLVRIILRTGQPGYAPEARVIMDYDINDYKEKTELTAQRLITAVVAALRSYRDLTALERNKRGLEQIIKVSPEFFRLQPLKSFSNAVLLHLTDLLYAKQETFFLEKPDSFAAARFGEASFRILAATGRFEGMQDKSPEEVMPEEICKRMKEALEERQNIYRQDYLLLHRCNELGDNSYLIYAEGGHRFSSVEHKLLDVFCMHVAAAFENLSLQQRIDVNLQEIEQHEVTEKKLQCQNEDLETALAQLRQAQMQMVQQEKLAGIGQLAAGVAHEINNPLAYISSNIGTLGKYLQILSEFYAGYGDLKEKMPSELRMESNELEKKRDLNLILQDGTELVKEASDGLQRISRIVKELRNFSQTEEYERWQEYDLNQELQSIMSLCAGEARPWAELCLVASEVDVIFAIKSHLNQALMNLLVNAIQAVQEDRREKKGLISLKTWQDEDSVYCAVEDNGIGIAQEDQGRIFDAFFTTRPIGSGVGLGLSIAREVIVKKHGGDIRVQSEPGKGTVVTLKLKKRKKAVS